MSYRYLTYFKLTSNDPVNNPQIFQIDIPLSVDLGESRFVVSGVVGKVKTDNTLVFIHSSELTTFGSWSSINNRNDTLNSCILGTTITKPINTTISSQDIGFVTPAGLAQNRRISFQLRDETDKLVELGATDYVVIIITFYSIGPQQSTSGPNLMPLYNYM
jgi:hypothetical protein